MNIKNSHAQSTKHCLYITYDGLLDPLGSSQILPYVLGLAEAGYQFTILSFEKTDRDPKLISELADELKARNIHWVHLPFIRGRFQGVLRMLRGANAVRRIARRKPFALAHMRTIVPAVIYKLALKRQPFIYDIRSFSGQWVDSGRLSEGSLAQYFLAWLEDRLIRRAAGLVVLDQSGLEFLDKSYEHLPPIEVIPTSTDLDDHPTGIATQRDQSSSQIRFVFLGGARFPYLPVQALQLVRALLNYGHDCVIHFINERDHGFIKEACQLVDFPRDRLHLFALTAREVQASLPTYDCGLVFIADGPWIRMSSPTKIGEYLAAGLHVVGLSGIAVLDRLAAKSTCVDALSRSEQGMQVSPHQADELISRIQAPNRRVEARRLADQHYNRKKAVAQYINLYDRILSCL